MLPWSNKSGPSSSGSSSIQRDENLANANQYRTGTAESSRFRSSNTQNELPASTGFDTFVQSSSIHPPAAPFQQTQQQPTLPLMHQPPPAADGAQVLDFLSSAEYTDAVHGEDLTQASSTYQSYRHQADHEHSMAERQRHQWTELLAAEDIVAYLQELKYTDDIYGAPPAIDSLIKEAQQEVAEQQHEAAGAASNSAVARLAMVRDHLMGRAHGQVDAAVKHANEMQETDWDRIFSKGGML